MTAEAQVPMNDAEADYVFGAVVGLAQVARLVPVDALALVLTRRAREVSKRAPGTAESEIANGECFVIDALRHLIAEVETLMEVRRVAEYAAAEAMVAVTPPVDDLPPSRRPLADDDVWTTGPARPR